MKPILHYGINLVINTIKRAYHTWSHRRQRFGINVEAAERHNRLPHYHCKSRDEEVTLYNNREFKSICYYPLGQELLRGELGRLPSKRIFQYTQEKK
jgi:hypothetical protein